MLPLSVSLPARERNSDAYRAGAPTFTPLYTFYTAYTAEVRPAG